MSRCDLSIAFARSNRRYRPGESVEGVLTVRANTDITCKRLTIDRYWRTHGKGNTDKGRRRPVVVLKDIEWSPGEYRYPFEFPAPRKPFSYAGHHLNVDHYVAARADIPWLDPKTEADFLIAPPNTGNVPVKPLPILMKTGSLKVSTPVIAIAAALMIIASIPFAPVSFFILPVVALIGFGIFRNAIAQHKLGEVNVRIRSKVVCPGLALPVQVAFRPDKAVKLNEITVSVTAVERCVSGSGTNKKTHRHEIVTRRYTLTGVEQLRPHLQQMFAKTLDLPADPAYTFESKHNKIRWELAVRIDVAGWPDWTKKEKLVMQPFALDVATERSRASGPARVPPPVEPPAPTADAPPPPMRPLPPPPPPKRAAPVVAPPSPQKAPPPPPPLPAAEPAAPPVAQPPVVAPTPVAVPEADPPSAPPPEPTAAPRDPFADAVRTVTEADRFSGERGDVVEKLTGTEFVVRVKVGRVDWTYGFDLPEELQSGRTVIGTAHATDGPVALRFPKTHNPEADALSTGAAVEVRATFATWSDVHSRPELNVLEILPA